VADPLTPDNRLQWLNTIQRYFDQDLTPAELESFNAALQGSAELRRLFLQYSKQSSALLEVLGVQSFNSIQSLGPVSSPRDPELDWVTELEQKDGPVDQGRRTTDKDAVSARQVISLVGYLLGRALASKPVFKVYGVAAAVLLVVTLFLVFSGEEDRSPHRFADQGAGTPVQDDPPVGLPSAIVATLTAQHSAQWAEGALAPGSSLHPNQTLTLTAGFAEITTSRGAVAIIEAPATIELLNNDNAIRLHAGRLVGICETASSKGLLVRTPHMDITDLSTRFGVDATQADATRVHVLEGEVEVVGVSASGQTADEPKRLTAGHALQGDPSVGLIAVAFEQSSFTQDVEHFSYRPQVQGHDAIWQGQASGDLSLHAREAAAVQIFIERKGVLLKRDTAVDLAGDRVWSKGSVPGKHTVEAGSRVDVYLLHLDPMRKQNVRGDYTVRFDRPILGVIAHQDTLVATDESLGAPGTTHPVITGRHATIFNVSIETQRGLDIAMSDSAAITDGGSVLHVKSNAASVSDQVRVLVRAMHE